MTQAPDRAPSVLAAAFTKRLETLGLSRRELVRRTGLSRQTLHNIEHDGRIELRPGTLRAIDDGLYWKAGTTLRLAQGDATALDDSDTLSAIDHESATRWRIVERITSMSVDDLDRLVAMMDGNASEAGEHPNEYASQDITERLAALERSIRRDPNESDRHAS